MKIALTCLRLQIVTMIYLSFAAQGRAVADERGNGGEVKTCSVASEPRIEMLDLYEARVRGFTLDLGSDGTWRERISQTLTDLDALDHQRADVYNAWLNEFEANAAFLPNIILTGIPDAGTTVIPAGCLVQQIATQAEPTLPGDKRYTISLDLWNQLDEVNKAVLVMHEIILRDAIASGQTASRRSRYFNGYLTSSARHTGYYQYFAALDAAALFRSEVYEIDGEPWRGSGLVFFASNNIQSGTALASATYQVGNRAINFSSGGRSFFQNGELASGRLAADEVFPVAGATITALSGYEAQFHPGGAIKLARRANSVTLAVGFQQILFHHGPLSFFANGAIESGKPRWDYSFPVWQGTVKIYSAQSGENMAYFYDNGQFAGGNLDVNMLKLKTGASISVKLDATFYPDGSVKSATLAADADLQAVDGTVQHRGRDARVAFDQDGLLKLVQ